MKVDVVYNKSCQRMDELPDESIDMIMTSCPYWGLRNYGDDVKEIWGGDPDCEHKWAKEIYIRRHKAGETNPGKEGYTKNAGAWSESGGNFCLNCNAWHGQLGLEPTFQLYLDHLMIVCAEIKRVLKKTGSFWLNMGDTYGGSCGGHGDTGLFTNSKRRKTAECMYNTLKPQRGTMAKCLLGIPWRLVLRLVDEQGWVLRNAGIWNKPNSMPSSTKDRLSNSYEFFFHLVKNTKPQYCWNEKTGLMVDRKPKELKEGIDWEWRECSRCLGKGKIEEKICPRCKGTGKIKHSFWHSLGYWYDLDAIREVHQTPIHSPGRRKLDNTLKRCDPGHPSQKQDRKWGNPAGKNPGDVWTIPTQPRPEAHFATFPDKLCIKPILATCPAEICKKCGKARVRITKYIGLSQKDGWAIGSKTAKHIGCSPTSSLITKQVKQFETIGWTDCGCNASWDSGILLDPFAGRGTSLIMAKKLGRHYIGYELKQEYWEMAERELENIDPLFRRS